MDELFATTNKDALCIHFQNATLESLEDMKNDSDNDIKTVELIHTHSRAMVFRLFARNDVQEKAEVFMDNIVGACMIASEAPDNASHQIWLDKLGQNKPDEAVDVMFA